MSCSVSINCPGYSGRKQRTSLHGVAEKRLDERSVITGLFWHWEHSKCRLSPPHGFRLLATSVLSNTQVSIARNRSGIRHSLFLFWYRSEVAIFIATASFLLLVFSLFISRIQNFAISSKTSAAVVWYAILISLILQLGNYCKTVTHSLFDTV